MNDWTLAIPTKLNVEQVQDDKTIYQMVKVEKEQRACSVAGTIYKFPGDYSAERLFAQLSSQTLPFLTRVIVMLMRSSCFMD
jgi:hypothetical protein